MTQHQEVHIVIDRKPKVSPNPTTGAALYVLGEVRPDYDLLKEIHGHGDDLFTPNTAEPVELHPGDHFYSAQRTLNPGSSR